MDHTVGDNDFVSDQSDPDPDHNVSDADAADCSDHSDHSDTCVLHAFYRVSDTFPSEPHKTCVSLMLTSTPTPFVEWVAWDDPVLQVGRKVRIQFSRGTYYMSYTPPGVGRKNAINLQPLLDTGAMVPLVHTKIHDKMASGTARMELTDDIAQVYSAWHHALTTGIAALCPQRCVACRARTPPQCVLCGGANCCPSDEIFEQLVQAPGVDLPAQLAGRLTGPAHLPERLLRLATAHGSVCLMCSYWHIGLDVHRVS